MVKHFWILAGLAVSLLVLAGVSRAGRTSMAKPPEKKPEPAKPTDVRVLPMELRIADRFTDATGEWEVISRPYASAGGKLASAHVRKIGRPESTDLRTWNAHERIAVRRA